MEGVGVEDLVEFFVFPEVFFQVLVLGERCLVLGVRPVFLVELLFLFIIVVRFKAEARGFFAVALESAEECLGLLTVRAVLFIEFLRERIEAAQVQVESETGRVFVRAGEFLESDFLALFLGIFWGSVASPRRCASFGLDLVFLVTTLYHGFLLGRLT